MADQHPITPPPELVSQWNEEALSITDPLEWSKYIATQAANWGADTELEACVEWLAQNCGRWELPSALRAARRPQPSSLAEQALFAIDEEQADLTLVNYKVIRAALERLKELEQNND